MSKRTRRTVAGIVAVLATLAPVTLLASPASAFPAGDPIYKFKYSIVATTFIKKAGLGLTTKPGIFQGGIDLSTGALKGSISLPPVTFTQSEDGVGLVTATSAIMSTKPVTGHVNIGTLKVTSTSTFNIHITSMYPATPSLPLPVPVPIPKENLVGSGCMTAAPISVTMSGTASFDKPSTFTGTFSIPDFADCQEMTDVINQEIPGPGNTFSATATPAS
jgi:hypothetical protein